jgi:hypothetical protein
VFLLVLSILTAIVWWRVLHRPDASSTTSQPTQVAPLTCTPTGKASAIPTPRSITVTVLNGAGREGLAGQVSSQLKTRGFQTGTPGNAPATVTGVGQIQYGSTERAGATLLSYYVPGAKLVAGGAPATAVQLVLGTGFQALAPQASVTKALAKATKSC